MQNYYGRDRIDFQGSKSMTAQQNCYIPNVYFIGNVNLHLQLPTTLTWPTPVSADDYFTMAEGWGFGCIRELSYYLGASSVANVQISGESNLMIAMQTCETSEKRRRVYYGAGKFLWSGNNSAFVDYNIEGREVLAEPADGLNVFRNIAIGTSVLSGGSIVPGAVFTSSADAWAPFVAAVVPVRLPWPNLLGGDLRRLPFDTRVLNQPINVVVQFRLPSVHTTIAEQDVRTWCRTATIMELQMQQIELSDKSLSLRDDLLARPEYNVCLPFQYCQTMVFNLNALNNTIGTWETSAPQNITSFMNADLTTIIFGYQEGVATNEFGNKNSFVELDNFAVKLNGTTFFWYNNKNYSSIQSQILIGDSDMDHPETLASENNPLSDASAIYFRRRGLGIYEVDFTRWRALQNESHMQNSVRFTNMTMQIYLGVTRNSINYNSVTAAGTTAPLPVASLQGQLVCTYLYNSVFQAGGHGGTSELFTT